MILVRTENGASIPHGSKKRAYMRRILLFVSGASDPKKLWKLLDATVLNVAKNGWHHRNQGEKQQL